ncbi:MAG: radical SAM protein [Rhodospirillales bacterium]|nr:radical SAM protein [Rhodospirillales bacterium]
MHRNPFMPLYAKCNAGNSKEKLANLPDFPYILDIELTNLCNFRCLMCPTGNRSQRREQGFMSEEIFARILEEIRGRNVGLRFIRWGEPLMHPKLLAFLRLAKSDGHLLHINTNGSHLTESMADQLLAVPIDSLKFSVQGVERDGYRNMRNIDFFDTLLEKAAMIYAKRGAATAPFLQISTTITYESEAMQQAFLERVKPICDAVNIGATSFDALDLKAVRLTPSEFEMLKKLIHDESVTKVHPECPEVFDKLSVNWDGTVSACCMDSDKLMTVGDLATESLQAIWRGEILDHHRRLLADMRHDELPLCRHCYDTHNLFVKFEAS